MKRQTFLGLMSSLPPLPRDSLFIQMGARFRAHHLRDELL